MKVKGEDIWSQLNVNNRLEQVNKELLEGLVETGNVSSFLLDIFFNIAYSSENKQIILFINKEVFYVRGTNSVDIFKNTLFKEFSSGSYLVTIEDKLIVQKGSHGYLEKELDKYLGDKNINFEKQQAVVEYHCILQLGLIYSIDLETI